MQQSNLKYFTQQDSLYVSKRINYVNLIIAVVISLLIIPVYNWSNLYLTFPLIGVTINLAIFGKKIVFDMNEKTITASYFGFFSKIYRFDQIRDIIMIRNLANGFLYNRTSIRMITVIKGKREEHHLLGRIWSRKKSEEVVCEINKILKIN
jgi:hypothetical protein